MSTISHTAIAIDGTTAWLVDTPGMSVGWELRNRPCDTCGGVECSMGLDCDDTLCQCPCLHCHGTGRHTFTLDVECDCPTESNPEPCMSITELTVHVVEVLLIYPIFGVGDASLDRTIPHIMMDGTGAWYLDGDKGIRSVTLSTDAAPGKFCVQLAVHT
jgi:hypothetical protein